MASYSCNVSKPSRLHVFPRREAQANRHVVFIQKGGGPRRGVSLRSRVPTPRRRAAFTLLPMVWPPSGKQTRLQILTLYFLLLQFTSTRQSNVTLESEISANDEPSLPFLKWFSYCSWGHPQHSKYGRTFVEGQLDYSNHLKRGREHLDMSASLPMPRHLWLPYEQISWWYSSYNCWVLTKMLTSAAYKHNRGLQHSPTAFSSNETLTLRPKATYSLHGPLLGLSRCLRLQLYSPNLQHLPDNVILGVSWVLIWDPNEHL